MTESKLRTDADDVLDQYLAQSNDMSAEMVTALRRTFSDFAVFLADFLKSVREDKLGLQDKVLALTDFLEGDVKTLESTGLDGVDLLSGVEQVMKDGMITWNQQAN